MSQREPLTELSDSDSSIRLNPQARRNVNFYGTFERTQMAADRENQNTLNRKAAVRQQENEIAKQKLEQSKKKQQISKEQEEADRKLEEYVRKKKEIEELLRAKELAEQEAGKAHRDAEQSRLQKEERDQQRRDTHQRASEAAKKRSNTASAAQKEMEEAIHGPKRKLMEKRNQILEQEAERAHKLAADYREDLKNRPEEVEEYDVYDKYDRNISRKLVKTSATDFTKSHVHNPIVVSHNDEVGQLSGFEAAELEAKKAETRRMEFTTTRDDQRQRSLDRWQKAAEKEKDKKELENFNREMERLQKAKNEIKIKEGKQYPEMQTKPATTMQNKARVQKESEKAFEDVFMKNNKKGVSEGNLPTGEELPPKGKSYFASKKTSSFKKTTEKPGKSGKYNFDDTQRTGEEEPQRYEEDHDDDKNVFKSEALAQTVTESVRSPDVHGSSDDEQPAERKYMGHPKNLQESASSASSSQFAQQEKKQPSEKPWKSTKNRSQDLSAKDADVEVYVPAQKPAAYEPQRNVREEHSSPEKSLEYSNQSSPAKDDVKSYGAYSFGEKQLNNDKNLGYLKTENLKPENLQRPFDYSYQQQQQQPEHPKQTQKAKFTPTSPDEETKAEGSSPYFTSYGAQRSQPGNIVNIKNKPAKEETISSDDKQLKKDNAQDDIRSYIQEQDAFLKKIENDRQKLTSQLRSSQASSQMSNLAASTNKYNQTQEPAPRERAQPSRQNVLSKENDADEEAIQELQEKAKQLLTRFMQPSNNAHDSESEESDSEVQSSRRFDQSLGNRFKQSNNFTESQSSTGYRQEPRYAESPERNTRLNVRPEFSSPGDLDYSVSDRDRSGKKSLAETMDFPREYQNDNNVLSFGQKKFNATETFGKKSGTFGREDLAAEMEQPRREKADQQKAWKMEFDFEENKKLPRKEKTNQQKGWTMDFSVDNNDQRGDQDEGVENGTQEKSLADLFKRSKKKMMEKYEHQKDQDRTEVKEQKPTRTKEEILKQRKAMMEYKGPKNPKASTQNVKSAQSNAYEKDDPNRIKNPFATVGKKGGKDPNPELLDRLAFGKKAKVDKKEMHNLTSKNYEMLPEVKKKKEMEQKKEEMKKRMENAKKLDQRIRSNSRNK